MLEAILLGFLLTIVIMCVLVAVGLGVFSWQLTRSNRVDPTVATPAPVIWLWAPTHPAKLHRRLRAAVRPMGVPLRPGRNAPAPPPHAELMRTLATEAVAIDVQVVAASRQPRPHRRRTLHALQPQVIEIERLSLRLLHQQRAASMPANIGGPYATAPSTPQVLADVSSRLDRLDEARQELLAIERENGLVDPEEVLRRIQAPAPAPAPVRGPRPGSVPVPGPPPAALRPSPPPGTPRPSPS